MKANPSFFLSTLSFRLNTISPSRSPPQDCTGNSHRLTACKSLPDIRRNDKNPSPMAPSSSNICLDVRVSSASLSSLSHPSKARAAHSAPPNGHQPPALNGPSPLDSRRHADSRRAPHLMTPPTTPSSTIRNTSFGTTSSDSSSGAAIDPEEGWSRILKLTGIPQDLSQDAIKKLLNSLFVHQVDGEDVHAVLSRSLRGCAISPSVAHTAAGGATEGGALLSTEAEDSGQTRIKDMVIECHAGESTALLAFWDLRDAQFVKRSVDSGQAERLMGTRLRSQASGDRKLSCEFLSAEELKGLFPKASSLLPCDGRLRLQIPAAPTVPSSVSASFETDDKSEGLNATLQTLRKLVAEIGTVEPCDFVVDHVQHQDLVLHVSYYDVRAADEAFTKLNRTSVHSRRIRVERANGLDKGKALEDAHDSSQPSPHSSTTNTVPFPILTSTSYTAATDRVAEDVDAAQAHPVVADAVGKVRPRSVSHSDKSPTSATASRTADGFPELTGNPFLQQDMNGRRPSNCHFFDAIRRAPAGLRTTEPTTHRPRSLSFGQSSAGEVPNGPAVGEHEFHNAAYSPFYTYPPPGADPERGNETYYTTPPSVPYYSSSVYNVPAEMTPLSRFPLHSPMNMSTVATARPFVPRFDPTFMNSHVSFPDSSYFPPLISQPTMFYHGPLPPPAVHAPAYIHQPHLPVDEGRFAFADPASHSLYNPMRSPPRPVAPESARPPARLRTRRTAVNERAPPPERNRLNLPRIEAGLDTRTTVMIQNIPIKMNDRDLEKFIADVCPRRIDFMYLRMDFETRCTVGYAFVNFITVQDLITFAKARLNVRWNMYSSEKVLQMSYANYQGKDALVEKFKNSCIMDVKESWRPRIYYSDGPLQGLLEPFPRPTHRWRKERSTHNRGLLFTPGHSSAGPHGVRQAHNQTRRHFLNNAAETNSRAAGPSSRRDVPSEANGAAPGI